MIPLIRKSALAFLLLAIITLPSLLFAQKPDVEIRQVKPLEDGTAAIKISVAYRNEDAKPFIFSYYNHPDQVFLQKNGFVTKVHLEEYEGNLATQPAAEWDDQPNGGAPLAQIEIASGDILFADYVYRVDPEQGFEVVLPSGNRIPFNQLITHLSHSFGDAQAFQTLIPTEIPNCPNPGTHEDLRIEDLYQLRDRIHTLQTKILKLGKEDRLPYI